MQERLTLKDEFGSSSAWESCEHEPIFRFWIDDETHLAFPFFSVVACRYHKSESILAITFPLGTLAMAGPKVFDFYTAFCRNRATLLKSDGKDITEVHWAAGGRNPTMQSPSLALLSRLPFAVPLLLPCLTPLVMHHRYLRAIFLSKSCSRPLTVLTDILSTSKTFTGACSTPGNGTASRKWEIR